MSVFIDRERCIGCGKCTESCPGSLIDLKDGKAVMTYPRDCWGCASCVKECPRGAISLQLGADIGGDGSRMYAREEDGRMDWHVIRPDGTDTVITVDRRDANRY